MCESERLSAERAKAVLVNWARHATGVEVAFLGHDRYRRALVDMRLNGRRVARAMVETGNGRRYFGNLRGGWCAEGRGGAMFRRILIANRGEIACRVIRTAREARRAHRRGLFRRRRRRAACGEADEAVRIGAAAGGESYLRGDAIIAAAQATRRRGDPSGLRLPVGERRLRRGGRWRRA